MATRRSFIKKTLGGTAYLLFALPSLRAGSPAEVWFVHISDTHNGGENAAQQVSFVLNDIRNNFPQLRFIGATGDITELGWAEELDENLAVMEASGLRYYNVMGNHDARWSRTGRKAFVDRFGDTRHAVHTGQAGVFFMDSSVLLEQYGFLDPFDLAWLEDHLRRLNGKPAVLGFHHPPSTPAQFIGSEKALYELAARYNISAILAGHIHTLTQRSVNGTWIITAGAAYRPESGYNIFRADDEGLTLFTRDPVADRTDEIMTIPHGKEARNAPGPGDLRLEGVRAVGNRIVVPVPESLGDEAFTLNVNGRTIEHEVQGSDIRIPLDTNSSGSYEVLLCSPDESARLQRRMWGSARMEGARLRWTHTVRAGIQCKPAVCGHVSVFGSNDGTVYGIRNQTGEEEWSLSTGRHEVLSGPVERDKRIYFGTIDREIYALDALTGSVIWRIPVRGSVIATGMFTEEAFIVGTGEGYLYAIDPADGSVRWRFEADNLIKATPAYDGRRLLFGTWDGHFYCVDARDGSLLWKKYINVRHFAPATSNPKIYEDRVFFVSHDYRTHCLDVETGDVVWQYPHADVEYNYLSPVVERCKPSYSSAVFHGKRVYFCSLTGHIVGFDRETGEPELEYPIDAPVFDSFPVRSGDTMYFGTIRGTVYAFDLAGERVAWKQSLGYEYIFSAPVIDEDSLYIGTLGGTFAKIGIA
jgi:outer membrane protein assembly factor BamB